MNAPSSAVDRVAVWHFLRASHAEVAQRLRTEECRLAGAIPLDGLPAGSRKFLWGVLQRWKPGLAVLLSEDEGLRTLKAAFDGSSVAIDTEDLIEAVWGYLQQRQAGEVARVKAPRA
jgi:hypothetical protein